VLTSSDSLIFKKLQKIKDQRKKAEVVFLSILNRLPTEDEKNLLLQEMKSSNSEDLADLIWALLNTPEFFFIK
jgi:Tfp pilus assembly protein PilO